MNQARVANLISKLNYQISSKPRRLKNPNGPEGRVAKIQKTLTALLKYERIELNFNRADETRGYAELLISQVARYGIHDKRSMELANYWIIEKQLIHKLFNVLLPRYEKNTGTCTNLFNCPREFPGNYRKKAILELKGNPFPSVPTQSSDGRLLLQNVLLTEAQKQYRLQQYQKLMENVTLK